MVHNIDAIYDHGVLRPVTPLVLPQGARVRLRIEDENGRPAPAAKSEAEYDSWLDGLAGRWHGEFVRGDEGDFETREPLS
jgi:predicted DNA-binding antitoxin AbrB/MazE fold protein